MLDKETLELFRTVAELQEQKYRLAENGINFIIKNNIKDKNTKNQLMTLGIF